MQTDGRIGSQKLTLIVFLYCNISDWLAKEHQDPHISAHSIRATDLHYHIQLYIGAGGASPGPHASRAGPCPLIREPSTSRSIFNTIKSYTNILIGYLQAEE